MASLLIVNSLITWYKSNARDLPWRNTRDPYKIWLSEIILQQTRVNQGLPYYLNFIKNYPTIKSLAKAQENDVLRLWQGLGYYSRARNIHKCAQVVQHDYSGVFPATFDDLLKLPGIGPYTAAAIASFAFQAPIPAIDGNALRVFTRLFGLYKDISKTATIEEVRKLASDIIPKEAPDWFNQAIMELGATICKPLNPDCDNCPLSSGCYAFDKKEQKRLPVKNVKQKIRTRFFNYFIFRKDDEIAMFERTGNDIWKGLYDFYMIEDRVLLEPTEISDPHISQIIFSGAQIDILAPQIRHILSHQVIFARFFEILLPGHTVREDAIESFPLNFYSKKEVLDLPKPVLVNNFLKDYFNQ